MAGELKFSSLSEQVYSYLRRQMNQGSILPGSTINIGEIAKQLGISKTPLRDALIHMEIEGFVEIIPRRGVRVNELNIHDVKNAYDAIGLVEAFIVTTCIDKIDSRHIQKLEELNETMISDIKSNDFSRLFKTNLQFHNVYLDISDNEPLKKFILPIKHLTKSSDHLNSICMQFPFDPESKKHEGDRKENVMIKKIESLLGPRQQCHVVETDFRAQFRKASHRPLSDEGAAAFIG